MKTIYLFPLRLLLLLAWLAGSTGCITEKDIRIEPLPPRPVLNAVLRPDAPVTAYVSLSSSKMLSADTRLSPAVTDAKARGTDTKSLATDTKAGGMDTKAPETETNADEKDSGTAALDNAVVELRVNGHLRGTLCKDTRPGRYSFADYRPAARDHVEMTVHTPGFAPATASTRLPVAVELTAVDTLFSRREDEWGKKRDYLDLRLSLKDQPGERNYYIISFTPHQVWRKGAEEIAADTLPQPPSLWRDLYSDRDFFLDKMEGGRTSGRFPAGRVSFLFADDWVEGKDFTLSFVVSGLRYSYCDDTLSCVNRCRIDLRTISESYYLYCRSKILQKEQDDILGETGLREPLPTYTNVQNGYGLLAAWQGIGFDLVFPFRADTIPPSSPFDKPEAESGKACAKAASGGGGKPDRLFQKTPE